MSLAVSCLDLPCIITQTPLAGLPKPGPQSYLEFTSAPTSLLIADLCVLLLPCSWEYGVLIFLKERFLHGGHLLFSSLLS